MADRLSSVEPLNGAGSGNEQAAFLAYFDRFGDLDKELGEAQETTRSIRRRIKDLRRTMKADGQNLAAFDRAWTDHKRSGEERDAEDRAYRRNMAWLKKPVGFQAGMDFTTADPGLAAFNTHQLHEIDGAGELAGKAGYPRTANPWTPGTEGHQRWDVAWQRGHDAKPADLGDEPTPASRGPGRPRKAANGTAAEPAAPKKRGRKPKDQPLPLNGEGDEDRANAP